MEQFFVIVKCKDFGYRCVMRINFELLDLRAFLAVYDLRNFHMAAEAVGLSQPALSRRIQALEATLGGPLLERSRRSVSPTNVGRELEPLLRATIENLEASILASNDLAVKQHGKITIASIPTAAISFLPKVVEEFSAAFPNIRFRILDLSSNEGLESIARGEVDFGINIIGATHPDVLITRLLDDPFVLACRCDHKLASAKSVTWQALADYRLIGVSRESGNRIVIENALASHRVPISWFYEVNHVSTAIGLVEAGLGISVLPRLALPQNNHPMIVSVPIVSPEITRTIGLLQRRGGHLPPAARRFRDDLLKRWGMHQDSCLDVK